MFGRQSILKISLFLLGFHAAIGSAVTLKEIEESQIHNFSTYAEADSFAEHYAKKIKAYNASAPQAQIGTVENPVRLYHVNKTFSSHVERALMKLVSLGIVVKADKIDPDQILDDLADFEEIHENGPLPGFLGMGDFDGQGIEIPKIAPTPKRGAWGRMMDRARYLLKIPGAVTVWTSIPRGEEEKKQANRLACVNATIGMCSIAISFAIGGKNSVPEIMGAGAGLWFWIWANMNWFRSVQEVMTQGKALNVRDGQAIQLKPAMPFLWSANYVRGLLTNAMIWTGCFGLAAVVAILQGDPQHAWNEIVRILPTAFSVASLTNALVNIFARSQVDKYITEKTPTPRDPPNVAGKYTVKKAARVRAFWEFTYGIIKNLDLVKGSKSATGGPASSVKVSGIIYKVMAVGSLVWLGATLKDNFKSEWQRLKAQLSGKAPKCEAFLVVPEPLPGP